MEGRILCGVKNKKYFYEVLCIHIKFPLCKIALKREELVYSRTFLIEPSSRVKCALSLEGVKTCINNIQYHEAEVYLLSWERLGAVSLSVNVMKIQYYYHFGWHLGIAIPQSPGIQHYLKVCGIPHQLANPWTRRRMAQNPVKSKN